MLGLMGQPFAPRPWFLAHEPSALAHPACKVRCLRLPRAALDQPLRKMKPWSSFRGRPAAGFLCALVAWSAYAALGRRTFCFTAVLVSRLALLMNSVMFASLGQQADGLMGESGISPLLYDGSTASWWDGLLLRKLQSSRPSYTAGICAIVAIVPCFLPVCAVSGLAVGLVLVWLSVVYRGYMQVDFLHYQWDALAMELSALAAIAALARVPRSPIVREGCAALSMHCFALLGFKLMWGSCFCKLFSNCPEWNFGTAMQHHHRTTCLPKPLARTMHRWSSSSKVSQAQVRATLWVEGPLSLLALLGWPRGRAICALLWCALMLTIAASGNYGLLTCERISNSVNS